LLIVNGYTGQQIKLAQTAVAGGASPLNSRSPHGKSELAAHDLGLIPVHMP